MHEEKPLGVDESVSRSHRPVDGMGLCDATLCPKFGDNRPQL